MKTAFLDTSFLLALELFRDQNHLRAKEFWQNGMGGFASLLTTDFVFNEIVTYLNSRGHHNKAVQVGTALLQSPTVEFLRVDADRFDNGWAYLQSHRDKTYSLTDCISFLVMQDHKITDALSFDSHFEQAGFVMLPG